jgi:predicted metal-dependent HD superfamily phosphohydrolase
MDTLIQKFIEALSLTDPDQVAVGAEYGAVVKNYSQKHRHYHNPRHVERLLELCEELGVCDPDIGLAIFYHDVIYRPGSLKNEEKSAALARESLVRLGVPEERILVVEEMILASASHLIPLEGHSLLTFLDLDMAILGAPPDEYREYAENIRKEYPWLPGFVFSRNRKQFLERMLAEDHIFHTELFREKFESRARENISVELERESG